MFQKIKKSLLAAAVLLLPLGSAQAMEPTLHTDALTPGMRGYAKTVVLGREIQTFNIEILGVIKEGRQSEGRILARASGDVIERTGGVLQGMSGSPVYVNGYLIGAVSGGWKEIDNHICTITPIGDMLKLWQLPDERSQRKIPQVDLKAAREKREANEKKERQTEPTAEEANDEKQQTAEDGNTAVKEPKEKGQDMATPLMVGGFSATGMDFLREKLSPYALTPYQSGTGATGVSYDQTASLEPGSSVGVQLVRGDISVAAIGTVTAVDGDKVLAFGHSFLHRGNVGYFMSEADIISTASGVNTGFKVGVPGRVVGTIQQDRTNGIAGRLGRFPQVVPMQVIVDDKGTAQTARYDVQITYHEELVPLLAAAVAYNAIEKSMDTATEGTVKLDFTIATNDGGGDKIHRENMYYAAQNVGQLSINELAEILNALCNNTVKEADIYNIKANVTIDDKRRTASILEMKPDKTSVKAGDTVQLTLKLKPYRDKAEQITVPFTIPKDAAPGAAVLEARGGGLVPVAQLLTSGIDLSPEEDKTKTMEATIQELLDRSKNNEIVIDIAAVPDEEKEKKAPSAGDQAPAIARKPSKHATGYIIDNVIRTGITIEKK